MKAAAKLFLERGYQRVSIDAITAITGGSKRDLYVLFGDKETLFQRAVANLAKGRSDLVQNMPLLDDPTSSLVAVGRQLLDVILSTEALALHRLMVSEVMRLPEGAAAFLQNGPNRAYDAVGILLRRHIKRGDIILTDADAVARMFVDALTAELQLRALLGETISPDEREAKVQVVVEHLLEGLRPRR